MEMVEWYSCLKKRDLDSGKSGDILGFFFFESTYSMLVVVLKKLEQLCINEQFKMLSCGNISFVVDTDII
jgi:hypothetical protein